MKPLGERTMAVLKQINTKKRPTVLEIAKSLGLERAQVQSVITRLENAQYVKRQAQKLDEPLTFALTENGKSALSQPKDRVTRHGGAHGRATPNTFASTGSSGGRASVMSLPNWIPLSIPVAREGADDFKTIPSKGIKT